MQFKALVMALVLAVSTTGARATIAENGSIDVMARFSAASVVPALPGGYPAPSILGLILGYHVEAAKRGAAAGMPEINAAFDALGRIAYAKQAAVKPATSAKTVFGARKIRFGAIRSGARLTAWLKARPPVQGAAAPDGEALRQLIETTNLSVNRRIAYRTDKALHRKLDLWSLPEETLRRGAGDCEDFAILKMGLLADAGVPSEQMSVTIVRDTRRDLFHAVLVVSTETGNLVLDNVTDDIRDDRDIRDYAPMFSLGAGGNHIFAREATASLQANLPANFATVAPGAE